MVTSAAQDQCHDCAQQSTGTQKTYSFFFKHWRYLDVGWHVYCRGEKSDSLNYSFELFWQKLSQFRIKIANSNPINSDSVGGTICLFNKRDSSWVSLIAIDIDCCAVALTTHWADHCFAHWQTYTESIYIVPQQKLKLIFMTRSSDFALSSPFELLNLNWAQFEHLLCSSVWSWRSATPKIQWFHIDMNLNSAKACLFGTQHYSI